MKVLIATGLYPPDVGGPATYVKTLHDTLPIKGIEVEVLPFGEVRRLPKIVRHVAYFFKTLKRGFRADIIFAQDPVSVGFPAMVAAKILRKPLVLKVVGDYAWEQGVQRFGVVDQLDEFSGARDHYSRQVWLLKNIERMVAESARAIIVPSRYLKKIVVRWKVEEEKIHVVYNAFEGVATPSAHIEERSGKTIISAGRLVPWKGFAELIELMPEIRTACPDVRLKIVGDGPDWARLEALVKKHDLVDTVKLFGNLPQTSLYEHIAASDVFVLNTSYEGFSHQLLEVMALGVPIVTTNVGGNPELIVDRESGLLVEQGDTAALMNAILELLDTKTNKTVFVENAQKKAAEFSVERMVSGTIDILAASTKKL
ncbi:MAG: hypothetical protein COZ49_03950 [Candidatus Yonathbacteria bacterium CG_4_10_14_3_um_filter_47_65]|uniref:Glycosyltransferase family 1 protein n=2 Tax=Parcubacteria group TaxID=1794811 RepID=A0A2M8D7N3_9BACT|nr:MAG: hypothetical protein AUJ44_00320 [Candidatus Nomurabacteria bacterium CG1_02_47_685]PIP03885.1 MAG: hypothetical protein COX54_02045 [Candidatus Yonathbacteria bacterium CG23_combo_of_CG06-09_8_20_14_all_46_18]PIQ32820.1 MAG: hypothetical protein COW61_00860 [Candidatus Yonathbacteria bacterium CG17_big_fil_post_rev_8_21_14_2_50_46_19]PIX56090.1 MAG: hypothetical protein COZ49_03950 [Candidatus Yonathbacteria bacterium CG_4_10_14_3_um_filter_47_65]PIY57812.1 MAG: hypothetical protein CO